MESRANVIQKSSGQLVDSLKESTDRLTSFVEQYSVENSNIASVVAMEVFQLVHDHGRKNPSLLELLGIKNSLKFLSTGYMEKDKSNQSGTPPLVSFHFVDGGNEQNSGSSFSPRKDWVTQQQYEWLTYSKWWEQKVLISPGGMKLSRKNLIHHFRHTKGGGHHAKNISRRDKVPASEFAKLEKGWVGYGSSGFVNYKTGKSAPVEIPKYGPEYASVFQIGYELVESINKYCSNLLEDKAVQRIMPMKYPENE